MAKHERLFSPALLNVVARFRTRRQARKAMDALEAQGFDAGAIRLEGAGPVTVAAGSDDRDKVAHAEEAIRDLDPIDLNRVDEHGEPV